MARALKTVGLVVLTIGLIFAVAGFVSRQPEESTFLAVDADERPLVQATVHVINADIKYKSSGYHLPPDLVAVKTDANGQFQLSLRRFENRSFMARIDGYRWVSFELSSDLSHARSNKHVRVLTEEPGTHRVAFNEIYGLTNKTVRRIALSGAESERPFTAIQLTFNP